MPYTTDDLRIKEIRELTPPSYLIREFPCGQLASSTVHIARHSAHDIIHGKDDRLLVIVGPCSIHDPVAAEEYAVKIFLNYSLYTNSLNSAAILLMTLKSSCGSISKSLALLSAGKV